MNVPIVDILSEQAEKTAAANPPSRVLATVILALFTAIGWLLGRTWYAAVFCFLAVRYGFRMGMKQPVEPVPATPQ
jgi:hypothetical protein